MAASPGASGEGADLGAATPGPAARDGGLQALTWLPGSGRPHCTGSLLPLHRLLQAELAPRRDDGQAALQVVADEVADAIEDPVLRPDLRRKHKAG